jgi:uncharacterized peroxidase-related enzyme
MPRIQPIAVEEASSRARELLDELASRGGEPGPMVRTMAQAPTLLRGYLDLNRALKRSHLDRRVSERISLAVQAWLGCDYCVEAHTGAARALGVSDVEIDLARNGTSADPRIGPMVAFGQQVLAAPAEITDDEVDELRRLGYSDEQIAEVPALVALNVMTGAFNLVAGIHPTSNARSAA